MMSQKPTSKVTRDPDAIKFKVFTPPLPEDIPIEGDLLARVLQLHMEDLDLNGRSKHPQFEPNKYLKYVYYEEAGVIRVEPLPWVVGI